MPSGAEKRRELAQKKPRVDLGMETRQQDIPTEKEDCSGQWGRGTARLRRIGA